MMDYNAYRQDRVNRLSGAAMSEADRQRLYEWQKQQNAREFGGGALSSGDMQALRNQEYNRTMNAPMSNVDRQRLQEWQMQQNAPAYTDYNTYKLNRMKELNGGVMSERDLQSLNEEQLKREWANQQMRRMGADKGVLSDKDIQALKKALNPSGSFEMPTYQEIYNQLSNLLNLR